MIQHPDRLREIEARAASFSPAEPDFEARLTRFAALWAHARLIAPGSGADWRHDLEPDLAVARAVNGLPPAA